MANIVIEEVSGKNYYKVISNDMPTGWVYDFIWTDQIYDVHKNGIVYLHFVDGVEWELTYNKDDTTGVWIVDSVLGTVPTDNDHLASLIANLKG